MTTLFCVSIHYSFQKDDLIDYLKDQVESKDKELFLVVTTNVERNQRWLSNHKSYTKDSKDMDAEILQLADIVSDEVNITYNPLCDSKTENLQKHW